MKKSEIIKRLTEIKIEVTKLGQDHLKDLMPIDTRKFTKELGFAERLEIAFAKEIEKIEKLKKL